MFNTNLLEIKTLGELKKAGYQTRTIKEEVRQNLIEKLQKKEELFSGIYGYEKTVVPELQNALLSKHNIILLGLRGQAKTRIARLLIHLLDEFIPIIEHSEVNDNPFHPISRFAKDLIAEKGDATPISWVHKSERYGEKLATPDVTVADLVGDIDPIKAATLKLAYSDERILHYGIIPRTNRGIFVINELPDLQPRIQVSLFNILQEQDIQIRGFKTRIPMDILLIFTANPEDYTNRGSIITPLKDRIDSQIITHYPKTLEIARKITEQESFKATERSVKIHVPELIKDLIEQIGFEARESEFVDHKSGVSARLSISAYENLLSQVERRAIVNGENETSVRIVDLYRLIPSITGKVELVYEGEQEGMQKVAIAFINKAIRSHFKEFFADPGKFKGSEENNPYKEIISWFNKKNILDLDLDEATADYEFKLSKVTGLNTLAQSKLKLFGDANIPLIEEFILDALSLYSLIGKETLEESITYKNMMGSMFKNLKFEEEE